MVDNPSPDDPEDLSPEELAEATEYAFWLCLGESGDAKAVLRRLQSEHVRRGSTDSLRRSLRKIAKAVTAARRRLNRRPPFESAKLLQRLLRFIVNETLRTGEPVKQITVAREVFRKADPGGGAVAAEIRRLRTALAAYYKGAGLLDPIRFQIPVGRYAAVIRNLGLGDPPPWLSMAAKELTPLVDVRPLNGLPGISVFPSFSLDGGQICFAWNQDRSPYSYDLFVQDLERSTPIPITSGGGAADISPAWSPDGRKVAFLRIAVGRAAVFVTSSTEIREQKLLDVFPIRNEILGRQLAWTPDGKALLFADKVASGEPFSIFRVALDAGTREQLTHPSAGVVGDSDPAVSPDGRALAFARTEAVGIKDIFLAPVQGDGEVVRLTADRKYIHGLAWQPDSSAIVFSSTRMGTPALWRVSLTGEAPERLPHIGERALYPACSSNASQVAYSNVVMTTSVWELPLGSLEKRLPARPRRLIHSVRNDVAPHFAPDGSKIAFASDRSGTFEIWICDLDGTNAERITSFESPAGAGSPKWSPDGSRIAFDCRAEGQSHIYVVEVATGRRWRLTEGRAEHVVPSWSRDGWFVYFSSSRSGRHEIWKAPSEGGKAVQLTKSGGFAAAESHDGRFVYYARGRTTPGLWRIPAAGGVEEQVLATLQPTFWGLWALVSDGIYFLDSGPEGPPPCTVNFFAFETGAVSQVAVLAGVKLVHYQGLTVSSDRQRLLYPQLDQSAGEVILARLL